jgi:hypothetical protein
VRNVLRRIVTSLVTTLVVTVFVPIVMRFAGLDTLHIRIIL